MRGNRHFTDGSQLSDPMDGITIKDGKEEIVLESLRAENPG